MMALTTQQHRALIALAEERQGQLTPDDVIAAAESPDSPLHSAFDWRDSSAAYKYRLQQARQLIRRVTIQIETPQRLIQVPYFVRAPDKAPDEQGYIALPRLKTDEDAARDAIVTAFVRAARALDDARQLAVALGLAEAVDELRSSVMQLRDTVARGASI